MPYLCELASFSEVLDSFGNFSKSMGLTLIISVIIALILHLIQGFALYKMAKQQGINKEWIAFMPIANVYLLGRIAEMCSSNKKATKYGKILYVLLLAEIVLAVLFLILLLSAFILILNNIQSAIDNDTPLSKDMFSNFIPVIIVYFILLAVSIVYTVYHSIALWQIYKMYNKRLALLFIIISVPFSFLSPLFLIFICNNYMQSGDKALFNLEEDV